jgi:hypothetical protein
MTYFEYFVAHNFSVNSSFKIGMLKLALFGCALLLVAMLLAAMAWI